MMKNRKNLKKCFLIFTLLLYTDPRPLFSVKKQTHAHAQLTWIIIHKDFNCEKFFTLLYRVQKFCSNATQSKLYSKLYPKQTKNKSKEDFVNVNKEI